MFDWMIPTISLVGGISFLKNWFLASSRWCVCVAMVTCLLMKWKTSFQEQHDLYHGMVFSFFILKERTIQAPTRLSRDMILFFLNGDLLLLFYPWFCDDLSPIMPCFVAYDVCYFRSHKKPITHWDKRPLNIVFVQQEWILILCPVYCIYMLESFRKCGQRFVAGHPRNAGKNPLLLLWILIKIINIVMQKPVLNFWFSLFFICSI